MVLQPARPHRVRARRGRIVVQEPQIDVGERQRRNVAAGAPGGGVEHRLPTRGRGPARALGARPNCTAAPASNFRSPCRRANTSWLHSCSPARSMRRRRRSALASGRQLGTLGSVWDRRSGVAPANDQSRSGCHSEWKTSCGSTATSRFVHRTGRSVSTTARSTRWRVTTARSSAAQTSISCKGSSRVSGHVGSSRDLKLSRGSAASSFDREGRSAPSGR